MAIRPRGTGWAYAPGEPDGRTAPGSRVGVRPREGYSWPGPPPLAAWPCAPGTAHGDRLPHMGTRAGTTSGAPRTAHTNQHSDPGTRHPAPGTYYRAPRTGTTYRAQRPAHSDPRTATRALGTGDLRDLDIQRSGPSWIWTLEPDGGDRRPESSHPDPSARLSAPRALRIGTTGLRVPNRWIIRAASSPALGA